MAKKYRPRIADGILESKLKTIGAVLIEGAKWCGKTSTAEQHAGSVVYMTDPAKAKQYMLAVENDPDYILEGKTPRLLDEWQIAPQLWDMVRFKVDHRGGWGQFILTGSAVPADLDAVHHSGTGRFARIKMRPMSLWESGDSNGAISLRQLFDGERVHMADNVLKLQQVAFLLCRGGWPQATFFSDDLALNPAKDYYDGVVNSDIQRADGVERMPRRVKRLMHSYARLQGSQASVSEIAKDIAANDSDSLDARTVFSYLNALERIFVVEDMQAWNPNIRSKTAIRSTDTRYFVDPSIATTALRIGPNDLMNDLNTFGFLFETMCVRDLRVYADALDGSVYHYRDKNGLECDAVLHRENGQYGLIEIKLGGESAIEEAAKNLHKLADLIDTTRMQSPAFLMVLTAVGAMAYQRKDGVWVVPIGCLKD